MLVNHKEESKQTFPTVANKDKTPKPQQYMLWEKTLSDYFSKSVLIRNKSKGKGELIIRYENDTELEHLIVKLTKDK